MASQNGGGVVEGGDVFFFPPLLSVQWPQQPQLNLQSCRAVHNWACAADQQQQEEEGAAGAAPTAAAAQTAMKAQLKLR